MSGENNVVEIKIEEHDLISVSEIKTEDIVVKEEDEVELVDTIEDSSVSSECKYLF